MQSIGKRPSISHAQLSRLAALEAKSLDLMNQRERQELVHLRAVERHVSGVPEPQRYYEHRACLADLDDVVAGRAPPVDLDGVAFVVVHSPAERDRVLGGPVPLDGVDVCLSSPLSVVPRADWERYRQAAEERLEGAWSAYADVTGRDPHVFGPLSDPSRAARVAAWAVSERPRWQAARRFWEVVEGDGRFDVRALARSARAWQTHDAAHPEPVEGYFVKRLCPLVLWRCLENEQARAFGELGSVAGPLRDIHAARFHRDRHGSVTEERDGSLLARQLRRVATEAVNRGGGSVRDLVAWWQRQNEADAAKSGGAS